MNRRRWMQAATALAFAVVISPLRALAAAWNRAAFEAPTLEGALQGMGVTHITAHGQLTLIAPDFAENGAIVQVEVTSSLPQTEAIALLAEKNPTPLIANFVFSQDAEPYVITRIKLAETTELKAIVKAAGHYYSVSKKVEVALGGCG